MARRLVSTQTTSPESQTTKPFGYGTIESVSDAFRGLGLQAVPNIAGALYEGIRTPLSTAMSSSNPQKAAQLASIQNPFINQQKMEELSTPAGALGEIGRQTAGLASYALPTPAIFKGAGFVPQAANIAVRGASRGSLYGVSQEQSPGQIAGSALMGAILDPIISMRSWYSKPGVYSKGVEAVTKAGEAGKSIDYNKVTESAVNRVLKKGTKLAQNKLPEIASDVVKDFGPDVSSVSPSEAYKLRGELTQSLPKGFFGKLSTTISDIINRGSAAERQATADATNILREELSKEIHRVIPETIDPDKFYSFYSKIGGDLPTWGKRILFEELVRRLAPGPVKSVLRSFSP